MAGAEEFLALSKDMAEASAKVASVLYDVFADEGDKFADDWRSNARETSGAHGVHYPDSIDSETRVALGIVVETGPNSSKKQGRMGRGFELGSQNQPPHLDGLRALPLASQRLARASDAAVAFVLP